MPSRRRARPNASMRTWPTSLCASTEWRRRSRDWPADRHSPSAGASSRALHQHLLRGDRGLARIRRGTQPTSVVLELPREARVREQYVEEVIDLGPKIGALDRSEHLDPAIEVARHQIGASDPRRRAVTRLECEEPAVLEEAPEDAAHRDPHVPARKARAQNADPSRDDLDFCTCGGCGIERIECFRV